MHEEHPVFEAPTNPDGSMNPDVSIWRYMDLAKFISMLEAQALHFARTDIMEDAFEGSSTLATLQYLRRELYGDMPDDTHQRFTEQLADANKRIVRDYTYLNCWHRSEHESMAMWKIYQSGAPQGIALRSRYRRLSESITDDRTIYIGTVSYVNYETDVTPWNNGFYPLVHKRKFFEYGQEIRAVYQSNWAGENGTWAPVGPAVTPISVDLDILVETVYVSPKAPEWFEQVVRDILVRYGRTWPVWRSNLEGKPVY